MTRTPIGTTVARSSGRLRVASYNIRHGLGMDGRLDLGRVIDVLKRLEADVIGLQEVDCRWGQRSEWQDQVSALATQLGYQSAFGANLVSTVGRDVVGCYGTAILSPHTILSATNTHLPCSRGTEQRGVLAAAVATPYGLVHFWNTHLQDHRPNVHTGSIARSEQADSIADAVSGIVDPLVLVGDFNAPVLSVELEPLRSVLDYAVHSDVTFRADGGLPSCIDHIFCNRRVSVLSTEVHRCEIALVASDHLPIVADISIVNEE